MAKSRYFGCQVPPGGAKKGCGGGAKVVDIEKVIRRLEKQNAHQEKRIQKLEADVSNEKPSKKADGRAYRRPGGIVDR